MEQRVPMKMGDFSVLDSEFNSIKDRYGQGDIIYFPATPPPPTFLEAGGNLGQGNKKEEQKVGEKIIFLQFLHAVFFQLTSEIKSKIVS